MQAHRSSNVRDRQLLSETGIAHRHERAVRRALGQCVALVCHHPYVRRDEQGQYIVSEDEMGVLDRALFWTVWHADSELDTLTGYRLDEFVELQEQLNELMGRNAKAVHTVAAGMREWAALPRPQLLRRWSTARGMVRWADAHGVEVPDVLRAVVHIGERSAGHAVFLDALRKRRVAKSGRKSPRRRPHRRPLLWSTPETRRPAVWPTLQGATKSGR